MKKLFTALGLTAAISIGMAAPGAAAENTEPHWAPHTDIESVQRGWFHIASGPHQSVSPDGSAVTSWAVGKISEGQFRAFAASYCPEGFEAEITDVFEAECEASTKPGETVSVAWTYGLLEVAVSPPSENMPKDGYVLRAEVEADRMQFEACMGRLTTGLSTLQLSLLCTPSWSAPIMSK